MKRGERTTTATTIDAVFFSFLFLCCAELKAEKLHQVVELNPFSAIYLFFLNIYNLEAMKGNFFFSRFRSLAQIFL